MEEVDAILLTQLREIGCDLDDDITGISLLESYQVIKCVTECLHRIIVDQNVLNSIPKVGMISASMNMSSKYKYATQLTSCIQDLGYKSDIGYQTFMYGNEHDIRQLLLFLIERISRDDEKDFDLSESDLPGRSFSVTQRLKNMNLNTIWIPPSSLMDGEDDLEEEFDDELKYNPDSGYYDNYAATPVNRNAIYTGSNLGFRIDSFLSKSHLKPLQRYAKFKLSYYQQKPSEQNLLLPKSVIDILEWNNRFCRNSQFIDHDSDNVDLFDVYLSNCRNRNISPVTLTKLQSLDARVSIVHSDIPVNSALNGDFDQAEANTNGDKAESDDQHQTLTKEEQYAIALEKLKQQLLTYEQQIADFHSDQAELARCETEYRDKCKAIEAAYKSKDELINGISTIKEQIEEISAKWEEIQNELLADLKVKKSQSVAQNEEFRGKMKRINELKKLISTKLKDMQTKETMIAELNAKIPQQWPPGRGSYTKRIIEIIGNVKKQNDETKKVLIETKSVQKDINTLNGKIERSFTVAEDVIYREANSNEWNRRCYKSLLLLQSTFDQLLEAVTNIGVHLREIRQLEEMVENEKARKTASNLARINADLQQIKLENEQTKLKLEQKKQLSSFSSNQVAAASVEE